MLQTRTTYKLYKLAVEPSVKGAVDVSRNGGGYHLNSVDFVTCNLTLTLEAM